MDEQAQPQIKDALLSLEKFLESGVHIGSKFRNGEMKRFIYKTRPDGLSVLDVSVINERVRVAARFLSRYEPSDILVVAGRTYAQKPAQKLAEMIGAKCIAGRFTPGTLTNPGSDFFVEPKIALIADPPIDRQAIKESVTARVPVIALCNTGNTTADIDYIIPANNNGKKSLALVYYLLAREILKNRGTIKSDEEFTTPMDDFETKTIHEEREFGFKEDRERGRERGEGGRGFERGGGHGRERGFQRRRTA
ncbi:30S ribosomal protein S2 [Candidatus Micrarchaeota archaeon]|nr:30S ribosomal protein S2 [Candidatus Micrarchaeota archaeon]